MRRTDLIDAIEAGIKASNPLPVEAEALREVGRTAKRVHGSFDGCPLTLAGLFYSIRDNDDWREDFVHSYDLEILRLTGEVFDWTEVV